MAPDRAWADCRSRTDALLLSLNRLRTCGARCAAGTWQAAHFKSTGFAATIALMVRKHDENSRLRNS